MKFFVKNSKILSTIGMLIVMAFPIIAAVNTVNSDSIGTIGKLLYTKIESIPLLKGIAGALTIAILGLIYQLIGVLLNKVSIKYKFVNNKLVASFLSKKLAGFLGRSSLYYNIKIDDKRLSENEKKKAEELKIELLKEHFRKHDPLLKIDIQKLTK